MAKNDLLLIDKILDEHSLSTGIIDKGKNFEIFAIFNYLKDYDLSLDEIEIGIVDGRDDAGIDGWYTFIDGFLINDINDFPGTRRKSDIQVFIITAKHHDTFRQQTVNNLCISIDELFDLQKDEEELISKFNDEILSSRSLLKEILIESAADNPSIQFFFAYLSRGSEKHIAKNIRARSDLLVSKISDYFSNSESTFNYWGASKLLSAFRKTKDFSAKIRFEENLISRGPQNYAFLSTLSSFYKFITNDEHKLKRYLFESNVRDYMGDVYVNKSISRTLESNLPFKSQDFWWLNNGITIIASDANVIGKEIFLKNIQIVNGLQTTETIYNYFKNIDKHDDKRCVLIKVVITGNKKLSDRIILATNNQTKVDYASLRSTDKIQRDIETLLEKHGWYYDRRKNYYMNLGKPKSRIVSIRFMSFCIMALYLKEPYKCHRARPKYMYNNNQYKRIFNEKYDLRVYIACLELLKSIEHQMIENKFSSTTYRTRDFTTLFRYVFSTLYVARMLGTLKYNPSHLIDLASKPINTEILLTVYEDFSNLTEKFIKKLKNPRRLHRRADFFKFIKMHWIP